MDASKKCRPCVVSRENGCKRERSSLELNSGINFFEDCVVQVVQSFLFRREALEDGATFDACIVVSERPPFTGDGTVIIKTPFDDRKGKGVFQPFRFPP
jgi:hypothetical protein